MNVTDTVKGFERFLDATYKEKLAERIRLGKNRLTISFQRLSKFDPELAELILDKPEDTIKACELAVEQLFDNVRDGFSIRVKNTPDSLIKRIRDVRSEDINKLISFEGIIDAKSEVIPHVAVTKFECPSCGQVLSVIQKEEKFKEPSKCGCGYKGKFHLRENKMIDAFTIALQELPENLKFDPELKRMNVFFSKDLTETNIEEKIYPGVRAKVTGILRDVPRELKSGSKSIKMKYILEALYIDLEDADFININDIKDEEMKKIRDIAKGEDPIEYLSKHLYSSIEGWEMPKKALVLQLFGGVTKVTPQYYTGGDINLCFIGDPGEGKTALTKIQESYFNRSHILYGKTTSEVGLVGAVEEDKILGGRRFRAGPIPLSHKGFCGIDEFNTFQEEQQLILNEPMQEGTVTISKGGVKRKMKAEVSFLVCANPRMGKFDMHDTIFKQVSMPPQLINRFDLLFIFQEKYDKEKEKKKALKMLNRGDDEPIDITLIKKYIALGKRINPFLSSEAKEFLAEKYSDLKGFVNNGSTGEHKFPITARHVDKIRRMAEAKARIQLKHEISIDDIEYILDLLEFSLKQSMTDPETGMIDSSLMSTGRSSSERSLIGMLKDVVSELTKDNNTVPTQDIMLEMERKGFVNNDKIDDGLEALKKGGVIFEPRYGFIGKVR